MYYFPESNNTNPLSSSELDLIPILLRFRKASLQTERKKAVKTNVNRNEEKENDRNIMILLKEYLIEKYPLTETGIGNLKHKVNNDRENGLQRNKEPEAWRTFIKREKELINREVNKERYDQFNYTSAKELVESAQVADSCIFFNTYIDVSGWHSPIIQMHLTVQKSIEQTNNLSSIKECHVCNKDKKKTDMDFDKIQECHKNQPSYKHYRILFLPLTISELNKKINKEKAYRENLKFSVLMHYTMSIQLALVTVCQFAEIIRSNYEFFGNVDNLDSLGISNEIIPHLTTTGGDLEIEKILKKAILNMKMPDSPIHNNFDFMYIKHKNSTDNDKNNAVEPMKNVWGAYYNEDNGLTYFPTEEPKINNVKKGFAELFFKKLVKEEIPKNNPFKFLDPIHKFHILKNGISDEKEHFIFRQDYNALSKEIIFQQ